MPARSSTRTPRSASTAGRWRRSSRTGCASTRWSSAVRARTSKRHGARGRTPRCEPAGGDALHRARRGRAEARPARRTSARAGRQPSGLDRPPLGARAGVDFPYLLWRALSGDEPGRVRAGPASAGCACSRTSPPPAASWRAATSPASVPPQLPPAGRVLAVREGRPVPGGRGARGDRAARGTAPARTVARRTRRRRHVSAVAGLTLARVDLEDPRWRSFVGRSPDALPFHHPAWTLALRDAYRFDRSCSRSRTGRVASSPACRRFRFPRGRDRRASSRCRSRIAARRSDARRRAEHSSRRSSSTPSATGSGGSRSAMRWSSTAGSWARRPGCGTSSICGRHRGRAEKQ